MDILEKISDRTRLRVQNSMSKKPLSVVKEEALKLSENFDGNYVFENSLKKDGLSLICEVKKASPSKGIISESFPYKEIAKAYENGDADAISCLTEPEFFLGSLSYLEDIKRLVKTPVLRKDFTVDEYMIYEAKSSGADAILLIASILDEVELKDYFQIADGLGLSVLFEAHDEDEIQKVLKAGARIVGVNNRNLRDFSVNVNNSIRFRSLIPEDVVFVSESGVKHIEDLFRLQREEVDAVLVGEALMRQSDPEETLRSWKRELAELRRAEIK